MASPPSNLVDKIRQLFNRIKEKLSETESDEALPPLPKPWVIYCCSAFVYLIFLGYCLAPLFESNIAPRSSAMGSQVVRSVVANAEAEIKAHPTPPNSSGPKVVSRRVIAMLNPLVAAPMEVWVSDEPFPDARDYNGMYRRYEAVQPYLQLDTLILYTGIWIVVTVAIGVLAQRETDSLSDMADIGRPQPDLNKQISSAEEFLTNDVLQSRARAADFYARSTLMLIAGVVMAFIGVGIFYVASQNATTSSQPEFGGNVLDSKWNLLVYVVHGIRPIGILIFLEGIAWFLLRQYRVLIEDYKSFHRMYLRRASYLVALKTLSANDAPQDRLVVLVASMLGEDLSGRLKQGETTETNQAVEKIEPNPVFALVTSMLDIFRQQKREG